MTASAAEKAQRRKSAGAIDLPTVQAIIEYRRTLVAKLTLENERKILLSDARRGELDRRLVHARRAFALAKEALMQILDEGADA